jgi:hypothetical protein
MGFSEMKNPFLLTDRVICDRSASWRTGWRTLGDQPRNVRQLADRLADKLRPQQAWFRDA